MAMAAVTISVRPNALVLVGGAGNSQIGGAGGFSRAIELPSVVYSVR
jgi:hypothetical protein